MFIDSFIHLPPFVHFQGHDAAGAYPLMGEGRGQRKGVFMSIIPFKKYVFMEYRFRGDCLIDFEHNIKWGLCSLVAFGSI